MMTFALGFGVILLRLLKNILQVNLLVGMMFLECLDGVLDALFPCNALAHFDASTIQYFSTFRVYNLTEYSFYRRNIIKLIDIP